MQNMPLEVYRDLYSYMEWADASLWRAALANDAARSDVKTRELLHHLHMVQRMFLAFWSGQSPMAIVQTKPEDFSQLLELKAWGQPYYAEVRSFLDTADTATLARPLVMPWVKQYEERMGMTFQQPTIAETMFQVVNHTTHHRAQINSRLRSLGGDPPIVDYIAWIWFGRPAADWELSAA